MSTQGSVYDSWFHRVQSMACGFTGFSLWPMASQSSVYGSWLHRVQSMALGYIGFSLWLMDSQGSFYGLLDPHTVSPIDEVEHDGRALWWSIGRKEG